MRSCTKIGLALVLVVSLLIGLLYWLANHQPPGAFESSPIVITFLGYTNPLAASDQRFAWFAISNHYPKTTELTGDSLIVKGRRSSVPRNPEPRLPEATLKLCFKLKPGETTNLLVGEPKEAADGGQWRLYVFCKGHYLLQPILENISEHGLSIRSLKRRRSLISCGPWLETPHNSPPASKTEQPQEASTQ